LSLSGDEDGGDDVKALFSYPELKDPDILLERAIFDAFNRTETIKITVGKAEFECWVMRINRGLNIGIKACDGPKLNDQCNHKWVCAEDNPNDIHCKICFGSYK